MWWIISGILWMTSASTISSRAIRPYFEEIMRAQGSSLMSCSLTPMENVWNGLPETVAIMAVTRLESMPPLRNEPTGTSLSRWSLTASSSTCSSSSINSFSEPLRLFLNVSSFQYCHVRICPFSKAAQWPAWSLTMPAKSDLSSGR